MKKILILLFFANSLWSQTDVTSWLVPSISYKANDKISLIVKPIVRLKNDLKDYNNTSLDLVIAYKMNSRWSMSLLQRHFYIPDGGDRDFIFLDINYQFKINPNISLVNKIRAHLAFNINFNDPDYFRWNPTLNFGIQNKLSPFVGTDIFIGVNGVKNVGARFIAGSKYKINSSLSTVFQYWRQTSLADFLASEQHMLVFALNYSL